MTRLAASPREAARLLGISPRHIYSAIAMGELRSYAVGRRSLVELDAIRDWLRSRPSPQAPRTNGSRAMPDIGRVKFFIADRGFGFITRDDGQDWFVHASRCGMVPLQKGDRVEFDLEHNERDGRMQCCNVRVLS